MMDRDSRISLHNFELFHHGEDSSILRGEMSNMEESNGLLVIESNNYL